MEDFSKETQIKKFRKRKTDNQKLEEECRLLWRMLVYIRADFKCEYPTCGFRWSKLDAHHYYSKGAYPHLRFDLQNGMALCSKHHTAGFSRESAHSDPLFREKILGKIDGFKAVRTEDWDKRLMIKAGQTSHKLDLKLEKLYLIEELKKYKKEYDEMPDYIQDLINKYI